MSYDLGIYELLSRCTVKVISKDLGNSGSGFFVAPGLVVTCAHVVSVEDKDSEEVVTSKEVVVRRNGKEWVADVRLSSVNPKIDIALLDIGSQEEAASEYVCWGDVPEPGVNLYSYGFPIFDSAGAEIPASEIRGVPVTVEYEGVERVEEHGENLYFQRFKKGQVVGGSSGAPLLNQDTWYVCGILKRTRDDLSDLGGAGVPISYLADCFPELKWFERNESPLWKQARERQITKRNEKRARARGWSFRTWTRVSYLFVLLSLIAYWTSIGIQSWQIATLVYSEPGLLQDQPVFQVLNYDPQRHLLNRLTDTRLFANFSYREFRELVSFRDIPVFVTNTTDYHEPSNKDKYVLRFKKDWYLTGLSGSGADILVRQDTTEYSDDFAAQKKCLEDHRRRLQDDKEHQFIEVVAPPFRSLGFLLPQEACWLFLETFSRDATFSELLDRAKRVREWKETVFLIPDGVGYRAELTNERTVTSRIYDYFQLNDLHNGLSLDNCSYRCTAYGDVGRIRRRMLDEGGPRRAVGIHDNFFLDSHVPTASPIKELSLWFRLKPWPERVPEVISIFDVQVLEKLRNFPMRIRIDDAGLSKHEFAKLAWEKIGRSASVPRFGFSIDTFWVFIGALIAASLDCVLQIYKKLGPATKIA